jgi:hypothetical protein
MSKIQVRIKAPFGELLVEAENPAEMLKILETFPEGFVEKIASENRKGTAAQIQKLLESSGIRCMVPARVNEMTKRGQVFKPDPSRPEFKLTIQGEQWVETEVLAKLRGKMS